MLLYGCTTWNLTKLMQKKQNGNSTRMLHAVLNESYKQQTTNQQQFGHLPPISQTIQLRQAKDVGYSWESKDKLISDILQWNPTHEQTGVGWPAKTFIHQLWADTWCHLKDLPRVWRQHFTIQPDFIDFPLQRGNIRSRCRCMMTRWYFITQIKNEDRICLVLRYFNHFRVFNTKFSLYINFKYIWFGLFGFYGISIILGYLMPSALYVYIYIKYVWFNLVALSLNVKQFYLTRR